MFKSNKYSTWYWSIITRAKQRSKPLVSEKHHVIPKCFKQETELVHLTPREHYICHLLLTKMVEGEYKSKMLWTLHRMLFSEHRQSRYKPSARAYESFRKQFYSNIKGKPFHWTDEHKQKVAAANRARTKGKSLIEQYGEEKRTK